MEKQGWYQPQKMAAAIETYLGHAETTSTVPLSAIPGTAVKVIRDIEYGKGGDIPLMLDCVWVAGYPLDTERPLSKAEYDEWAKIGGNRGQMNRYCFNRHNGVTNCSFLDGSCREVKLEGLWTLKWHRTFEPAFGVEIEWLNR